MAIALRSDFDAFLLRAIARKSKDSPQARRLLALAAIYDGATRTEAARIGGVTVQIVRDWVVRFNADGPEGLVNRKAPGQPSKLNDVQRAALIGMIESGPIPAAHGVVRWRLVDLCQWIWEEFRISLAKHTLSRELLRDNQKPCSSTIRRNTSWLNRAPGILGGQSRSRQRRWPKGPGLTGQDTGRTIEIVVHPMIEFQCGTVPL